MAWITTTTYRDIRMITNQTPTSRMPTTILTPTLIPMATNIVINKNTTKRRKRKRINDNSSTNNNNNNNNTDTETTAMMTNTTRNTKTSSIKHFNYPRKIRFNEMKKKFP